MIFYKNKKGSALVFSMIILGIMILTGLSFAAITVTERKNAISTGKSTQAFQSADSAAELALAVLKDYQGSAGTLGEFAGNLGAICSDGADGLPAKIELSDSSLNFFDVNSDPIEECGDAVYKIAKIKSL
ncbi:MAG TPA: hypothetical protein DIT25_04385, partial [Candidatus Moranbacteria bacterium]|nr:hypothetical protein [Candidatus Moranbacteria bacterium]